MRKKAKAKAKTATRRKRTRDLGAKKAGAVRGGLALNIPTTIKSADLVAIKNPAHKVL